MCLIFYTDLLKIHKETCYMGNCFHCLVKVLIKVIGKIVCNIKYALYYSFVSRTIGLVQVDECVDTLLYSQLYLRGKRYAYACVVNWG